MPDEPLQTFESGEQAFLLAKAIVDTVREPLLVLDEDLRIVVASRSFYRTFEMTRPATQGHKIYDLEDGLWDIPELRLLLEKIVPEHEVMEGFEVARLFPRIGRRTMLLFERSSTKAMAKRQFCSLSRIRPSAARASAPCKSCWSRRRCCSPS